jgi:hypothetical protein
MKGEKLKEYLLQIANQINEKTKLEDIYEQLSLLSDIDQSEQDEKNGQVLTHEGVAERSKEWLK